MAYFGSKVIRDFMPLQHQDSFSQLPFIVAGYSDLEGNPWASLLSNESGLVDIIDDRTLRLKPLTVLGDPLNQLLDKQPTLGLLGIELATRRRNQLSTQVQTQNKQGVVLTVRQSFGNCPQCITSRDFYFVPPTQRKSASVSLLSYFDQRTIDLIKNCDTFFVASIIADKQGTANEGADVSHRGGTPGFIRVDDEYRLTIPDYRGNNHFITLGNFIENGRAGLLFVDFEQGHMLSVYGHSTFKLVQFNGAQHLWTFCVQ